MITTAQVSEKTMPIFMMILMVVLYTKLNMWVELATMTFIMVLLNMFICWWINKFKEDELDNDQS